MVRIQRAESIFRTQITRWSQKTQENTNLDNTRLSRRSRLTVIWVPILLLVYDQLGIISDLIPDGLARLQVFFFFNRNYSRPPHKWSQWWILIRKGIQSDTGILHGYDWILICRHTVHSANVHIPVLFRAPSKPCATHGPVAAVSRSACWLLPWFMLDNDLSSLIAHSVIPCIIGDLPADAPLAR